MRAVVASEPGGPEVLSVSELPDPEPGPGEVLIDVAATALNRADLLQRQGFYPPPPGASDVLGHGVQRHRRGARARTSSGLAVGDEVCALLAGGGYAEKVAVPAGQVMPVPAGVDLVTAAALPEVACTVWSNVFMVAGLQPRRDVAGARRRRRHRHVRDPARRRARRPGDDHRRLGRRSSRCARSSAPT